MVDITDSETLHAFPEFAYDGSTRVGKAGFITDFLGTRTRTAYIAGLEDHGGTLESYPIPTNFHATQVEWAGSLSAVIQARNSFTVAELGAGWCPWLVATAKAAMLCGIVDINLCGVEACLAHLDYARQHFLDNGLDPGKYTLLHGVVATHDGVAQFPKINAPASDWGAHAVIDGDRKEADLLNPYAGIRRIVYRIKKRLIRQRKSRLSALRSYSVQSLLKPLGETDLLHIDIQGHEYDIVAAARTTLDGNVKRMVIGTHSDEIDSQIRENLSNGPWELERSEACMFDLRRGKRTLARDGCQVWRNTAICQELTHDDLAVMRGKLQAA